MQLCCIHIICFDRISLQTYLKNMPEYQNWTFPDTPKPIADILTKEHKKLVIIGVIGKSGFPDCKKLAAFKILDYDPDGTPEEGRIRFYYSCRESFLLLHFDTTFDESCMQKLLMKDGCEEFFTFNQRMRSRFARMLLLATQVCHIIVFVEGLSVNFDASLLSVFKGLKIIRDTHVLKFLPKLIKNSNIGGLLGKSARLCSPRMLFLFENYPDGYEKTKDSISKLEFEVEDNIYKMLRNEFIIMNMSSNSLFSIPSNKRFVYFNADDDIGKDTLLKKIGILKTLLDKSIIKSDEEDDLSELRPYMGFGKPLIQCKQDLDKPEIEEPYAKRRSFMSLLKEHVEEALHSGFDDSVNKYRGRSHFVLLNVNTWYETFKMMHTIFIKNPDNPNFEANDADYKAYLKNFDKIINIDNEFFTTCCDNGLQKAYSMYNNPTLTHYSGAVHKKMVEEAVALYHKYARGPNTSINEMKLREMCTNCWENGKLQCEEPSLHGFPCILPKHIVQDPSEHNSGHVFVSTCNCGHTQGRREDPYTMRLANYDFYEYMAKNCTLCVKVKKFHFPVFEPSINDYRAAELEAAFPRLKLQTNNVQKEQKSPIDSMADDDEAPSTDVANMSQPLTAASQDLHTNLSLDSMENINKMDKNVADAVAGVSNNSSDEEEAVETVKELVLHVKDKETQAQEARERSIYRQPSTTEFLPGMVHTESPLGLLPLYPSWSLVCVGASSVYSHNTGLMEHFQSGFLSGSNFLLPWDVQVRLEHSASWAAAFEKSRFRKMGEVFILKVFVGYEYECPRGHRFMLSSPDKVMRGSADILRDSGSKIVFNNMPIYFPCVCRSQKPYVAQLMRIHVVTPKAPVNVILEPKVRVGDYVFTLGMTTPPKLTQSAYWILRLPYVYGYDAAITPPPEITASTAISYGTLLAGMFGVTETELDD